MRRTGGAMLGYQREKFISAEGARIAAVAEPCPAEGSSGPHEDWPERDRKAVVFTGGEEESCGCCGVGKGPAGGV
jgi:hypothetical protein